MAEVTERFVATSALGEHVVRTNNREVAVAYAARLGGVVIDREKEEQ